MAEHLEARLYEEVEGTCSGRYGYIVAVVNVENWGQGVLQSSTGFAEFTMTYKAVVFKPFKNQVVDGIVTLVTKTGIWVDVGPVVVYVSSYLVPREMKFDHAANPPAFVTEGEEDGLRIEKGQTVRLRIVGTQLRGSDITAIGTIKEDYLGPQAST
ncbi:DNA-directed RNA polymerase II subunit [Borealophlyctis nickersoniae]|nr:DNA-directed RNA polymerase II subunit [Borealophlyctis nickersoniae]